MVVALLASLPAWSSDARLFTFTQMFMAITLASSWNLTGGFTGKFAVFSAAVEGDLAWLAVVGVIASAAAVFFYVRLIVLMFFTEPEGTPGATTTVVRSEGFTAVAIGLGVVGTVALGVLPSPALEFFADAAVFLP